MLFEKKNGAAPKLSQTEREAMVDLLHLCTYADAHISLKEGEFISEVVGVIGWDENLAFQSYEAKSVAAARAARADEGGKKEFIADAASRLKSPAARELAVALCRDLLASDGVAAREEALLNQIRAALDA